MNERIEKLGEQADLLGECTPTKIPGRYVGYITEQQILKFAELIVLEMCQVMKAEGEQFSLDQNFDAVKGVGRCMRKVKQHFGVEE